MTDLNLDKLYTQIQAGTNIHVLAQGLAANNIPLDLVWYFQGPIVTVDTALFYLLPTWLPAIIYTERLNMILEEAAVNVIGLLATDADALAYLFSAVLARQLSTSWATSYSWLAEEVLFNHGIASDPAWELKHDEHDSAPHDCDQEPEALFHLRLDLRESIIRFARIQQIAKFPYRSQPAPPLPAGLPTFRQHLNGQPFNLTPPQPNRGIA